MGAESDLGDVDMAVRHEQASQILLVELAARRGELRHCADRRSLGRLAARIGIYFRVDKHDVQVGVHSHDVIQAAVADVVGPAVAAVHPNRLFDDMFFMG